MSLFSLVSLGIWRLCLPFGFLLAIIFCPIDAWHCWRDMPRIFMDLWDEPQ